MSPTNSNDCYLQSASIQAKQSCQFIELTLFTSFSPITLPAKHLAVGFYCSAAFAPGGDVVALHLLEGEFLLAVGTDVVLLLPYGELDVIGEGAEVEIMLITGENVGDDAKGLLDVAITHETGNLFLYC